MKEMKRKKKLKKTHQIVCSRMKYAYEQFEKA